MPTYETTKFLSLPQQVNKNKKDIEVLQQNQADISNLIPNTEKGQPLGVATLDAAGKVPSAQLPSNPGNFLPLAGGTMTGILNMGSKDIVSAQSVDSGVILSNNIRGRTNTTNPILIENTISMNNKKITNTDKGTANGDVATVDNINDHDVSQFAHADIRNLISAIQGAYIYRGVINENTIDVTQINLNARILVLMGRAAILGDVLTDLDRTDWYFDGTSWDNMGQTFVVLASAVNDGLMSKEDYTKLFDLYTKAQLDAKFEVLANKAIDFSTVNDTKYPTTKAVSERLLNLPIAELNNHTLREVFEGGQLFTYTDLSASNNTLTISNNIIEITVTTPTSSGNSSIYKTISPISGNAYYTRYDIYANYSGIKRFLYAGFDTGTTNMVIPLQYDTLSMKYTATTGNTFSINHQTTNYPVGGKWFLKNIYHINQTTFGISSLTVTRMDYWFNVYQGLKTSETDTIFSMFAPKQQEAWLTPTLTSATSTYICYRKDTLGTVIVEGNITVTTAGTNLTLPVGYRPLFAYTIGILTFNTDGTVVSSATGTQTLSVRYTGA